MTATPLCGKRQKWEHYWRTSGSVKNAKTNKFSSCTSCPSWLKLRANESSRHRRRWVHRLASGRKITSGRT
ncbi:MAG: hypothetical protein DMF29_11665 [Verrucomicrobia bacterium]|nr:MAG: hypothetical protein DMF29_11665 [Verrucomicrobiota bacterium]